MRRSWEPLAIGLAVAYVVVVGWAMATLSFDIWGALVMAPFVLLVSVPILRRIFPADRDHLFAIAVVGLVAKLGGTGLRYWVAFDAYGGSADAARYHDLARVAAADIRSGAVPFTQIVPTDTGTEFIEQLTTAFYTVFGSSRLGGFVLFAWMAYWGAVLFLRAAMIAVPGLSVRRYALLVMLAPTMLYWPSSIGKEAWLMLCLGIASYGAAHLFAGRWGLWPLFLTAAGTLGAGWARPHFATLWVGGMAVALFTGLFTGSTGRGAAGRLSTGLLVVLAAIGLFVVATATMEFLKPIDDSAIDAPIGDRLDNIFAETERRTTQGGSSFEPITINGPQDWPVAVFRTLTRPLLNEAGSLAETLAAVETTLLLGAAVVGWRRFANLPRLMARHAYLVFAMVVLIMFGLAFTRFGNLGILTRQRSLVMPLILLLWCVPPIAKRQRYRPPTPLERYHPHVSSTDRASHGGGMTHAGSTPQGAGRARA